MELSDADRSRLGAEPEGNRELEERDLAPGKKNALKQGRTIVLADESGLSERPTRCRTWAPRGQTPLLLHHFNWHQLSAAAALTWWNFYFQLFPGTIKAPQVVEFLKHLLRHIKGPILLLWDRLSAHRSAMVRHFIDQQGGRLVVAYLPPYAPELNPVEYLWGYWKRHALPNLCAKDLVDLSFHARRALRRMRRRPSLIAAFWKQAELF